MHVEKSVGQVPAPQRGFLTGLFDLWSSVWLGVFLLVLIFIYSSIGSALPPVRQSRFLELTEFEWFHWWPFDVLLALFVLNLVIVTLRRIPFKLVNLGVWMIHTGIIILCIGSVYYFGTKVEGDIPVFRRQVVIDVPGAKQEVRMLAVPGNKKTVEGMAGQYTFQIAQIQPEWPLQSEPHVGEKAYSVSVSVKTPQQQFIRQMLAGFPQYTEDIIPGQGRAVKATGKKLLDESVRLALDYAPQEWFHLQDSAALYLRPAGAEQWLERPIPGLPHYHERFADHDQVWGSRDLKLPLDPLDIRLADAGDDDPFQDLDTRVTGYLRYAMMQAQWRDGGSELNPVVMLQLHMPDHSNHRFSLAAFDPNQGKSSNGLLAFRWVASEQELEQLAGASQPLLHVSIPETDISMDLPVTELASAKPDLPFTKVPNSDYEFRCRNRVDDLPLQDGRVVSVVIVDIRTPQRTFTRMVADNPRSTRDIADPSGSDAHGAIEPDPGITMTYTPSKTAPVTIAAGPEPIGLKVWSQAGQMVTAQVGQQIPLANDMSLTLTHFYPRARQDVRPQIVPFSQRDRDVRKGLSMIEVSLTQGQWQRQVWLPYHHYAFPNPQYRYGSFRYDPETIQMPDGRELELMYSRRRHRLPSAVALEDFRLLTHQGGLIGRNSNVRDYISRLRFADAGGQWSEPMQMRLNDPANRGSFWFFQSFWDSPAGRSPGMSYTGLGVGNRNGVYVQLAGTAIAVMGMIFAFYIKPLILRRRRMQVYAQLGQEVEGLETLPGQAAVSQPAPSTRDLSQPAEISLPSDGPMPTSSEIGAEK